MEYQIDFVQKPRTTEIQNTQAPDEEMVQLQLLVSSLRFVLVPETNSSSNVLFTFYFSFIHLYHHTHLLYSQRIPIR